MFSFRPITETDQQLEQMRFKLLEKGIYDFVVENASHTKSRKTDIPMIKLVLKVWDHSGNDHLIFDHLMDIDSMRYKLKHFCEVVGLEDKLSSGSLNDTDCIGKGGKVSIIIQKSKDPQYGDKNSVYDYVKNDKAKNDEPFFDDDLPL